MKQFIFFIILSSLFIIGCEDSTKKHFSIEFPNGIACIYASDILLNIQSEKKELDSVQLSINGVSKTYTKSENNTYTITKIESGLGMQNIDVIIYYNNKSEQHLAQIQVLSDIEPKQLTFRVLQSFEHDSDAYTQGLEFDGKTLYEGTGLNNKSSLRRVDFTTGKVSQKIDLQGEYFGEGITIFNNKIYQLTWRSNIGFVYEKNTFKQIATFNYNTEGWGLCNDGTSLIMSDGTEFLYYLHPETFAVIKKIAVYDNLSPIKNLNELEFVNGKIYANIYTTDFMVEIDAKTGKVLSRIDMSYILDQKYITDNTDVLNGIAFNKTSNTFFITGKNWSKMFEVNFVPKQQPLL